MLARELFGGGSLYGGLSVSERRTVVAGLVVLALLVVGGVFGVFRMAEDGRERDLAAWNVRLSLVAEGRAAAVDDWAKRHQEVVAGVANNTSVRLYVGELVQSGTSTAGAAQAQYLENLLNVSADRGGFGGRDSGVAADVAAPRRAGIAIYGPGGRVLATTPNMPDMRGEIAVRWQGSAGSFMASGGGGADVLLAFAAPVFGVQSDPAADEPLAWVVGARPPAEDLYALLEQPGAVSKSGETYLAVVSGARVRHLSPLRGAATDGGSLPADVLSRDGAALFAASGEGGMKRVQGYAGRPVLAVGLGVGGTLGWTLVRTVDADEALAEIESRRTTMLVVLGVSILAVAALILLVWRHAVSVRAGSAARQIARSAFEYERLSGFLELVSDNQPTSILVVEEDGSIRLANRSAADEAGMEKADIVGKDISVVFGGEIALRLTSAADRLAAGGRTQEMVRLKSSGGERTLKADLVRLDLFDEGARATLMVIEDMSELMAARARRERSLKSLVRMVVALIDARDPYSAHHSARVAEVAATIASSMLLESEVVETVETAGALLNLGKLTVPKEILTKPEDLTPEEMEIIRESLLRSSELLDGIEFDGPVAETLRQIQAHWDGSGRPPLAGNDILIGARILAVANTFVALISPRAHRPGIAMDAAIRVLMEDADKAYDHKVVAALVHYLENEGGRGRWAGMVGAASTSAATDGGASVSPVD